MSDIYDLFNEVMDRSENPEFDDPIIIMGDLNLKGARLDELPKNLIVWGSLDISDSNIGALSPPLGKRSTGSLSVGGDMIITNSGSTEAEIRGMGGVSVEGKIIDETVRPAPAVATPAPPQA